MFDYVTELKVYDAKKIVSDALIGSFKFDLGLVYDEEDHCYIHKWLLLTDPFDPSSEAKACKYHMQTHLHTHTHTHRGIRSRVTMATQPFGEMMPHLPSYYCMCIVTCNWQY